ncbi:hypothetical protein F511_11055 [Dorcoceras hygrometricum]|uniref:Polygalacturonase n=1 Tax=Dorcoceras hygrometricum TaxID=472368 RepID=A0A2Z7AQS6_9LAMI|nr:hypothetical protein F511_11055 [Dorcoceras hygrometricum]
MTIRIGVHAICLVLGMACFLTINGIESNDVGARGSLSGETVFDIMKFGAVANGRKDNSMAIIRAWNAACRSPGPAKLLIPRGDFVAGEVVLRGPCVKPIVIEIQGNLLASTDLSLYSGGAWLMIDEVIGVEVTGGGTINGRGQSSWQYGKGKGGGPRCLCMGFHTKVTDSSNVALWNLKISAPGKSPNTDGLHISSSMNVNITDSIIGTGDDCVSVGHGNNNVLVARIFCGPGHGLSVGSLGKRPDETNLSRVTIINCTLTGTTNGARIKTYHASPRMLATGIYFQDLVMNQVKNPIIIDQHYDSKKKRQVGRLYLCRLATPRGPEVNSWVKSLPAKCVPERAEVFLQEVFLEELRSSCNRCSWKSRGLPGRAEVFLQEVFLEELRCETLFPQLV